MPRDSREHQIPQLDRLANAELGRRSLRVIWIYFLLTIVVAFVTDLHRTAPEGIIVYAIVSMILGGLRMRTALRFEKDHDANPRRWIRTFASLTLLQATIIGSVLPIIFFLQGAGWTFIICLLSITGISAGAASSLSPRMTIYRAFQIMTLGPSVATLLIFGEGRVQALSLLVFMWIAQVLVLGRYFHHEFWSGLRAQHQLKLRAEALEKAKREVEEASRVKGDFLANTSHEIRTPLNGIIGMTDLVLESNLTDEQREQLADVKSSGETLLKIINEILDFSKLEAGRVELEKASFSLEEVIARTVRPLRYQAASRGNELVVEMDESLPERFVGDPHRLWQVLTNLAGNAVKFTEDGRVTISVQDLGRFAGKPSMMIRVQDTGIGIKPEAQATIFEAFSQADGSTTRQFGGTGLGLAIAKKLIDLMGGEITLTSAPGQGSTFAIVLHLPEAPPAMTPERKAGAGEDADSLSGVRVLLVEDNTVNAKLATRVLEKSGVEVDWAEDGQQAVEAWQKGSHDIVLMDVQMPVMDGFEATRTIRAEEGGATRIPIIALTAHAFEGYRQKCLDHGMDDYLTKPLNPRLLRATLRRWVAQEEPQSV